MKVFWILLKVFFSITQDILIKLLRKQEDASVYKLYLWLKHGYLDSEKFYQSGYFCDDPRIHFTK